MKNLTCLASSQRNTRFSPILTAVTQPTHLAGRNDAPSVPSSDDATPDIEALVVENLPLVGYQVTETLHKLPPTVAREDLESAGRLALVLAARAYDPSTGVPFARYAALRIRGALIDELRSMDWASRGARRRARELAGAEDRLAASLGRTPTREELAAVLGTDVETVDAARRDAERRVLSLDVFHDAGLDVSALGTAPGTQDAPTPEEHVLVTERLQWLRAAVVTLPARSRAVVEALYLQDRGVQDLADELGVTPSRVSQLRTEALTLLRDGMNAALDPDLVTPAARPDGVAERRRQAYFAAVASRAALGTLAPFDVAPPGGRTPQDIVA